MSVENIDIDLEMSQMALAGMSGEDELRNSVKNLAEHFEIVDSSPEPSEIVKEVLRLKVNIEKGLITDDQRDERLQSIVSRALSAKDKLLGEDAGGSTLPTS